jgi:hypothetical protein
MHQKGGRKQVPFTGPKNNVHHHIKFIRLGDMSPRIYAHLTCCMLEEMLDMILFTSFSCLTHDEQIIENCLIFLS